MIATDHDSLILRAVAHGLIPCSFLADQLITARVVAEQLNVCTETVLRWTRDGKLPGFRLPGGALRYREDDIAEWLGSRATPAKEVGTDSDVAPSAR